MPVYKKDNNVILHIHIPKTGGTSVESYFRFNGYSVSFNGRRKGNKCTLQHFEKEQIEKVIMPKFNCNYTFICVRHPFDRAISECKWKNIKEKDANIWLKNQLLLLKDDPYCWDNHFRPQVDFITHCIENIFFFEKMYFMVDFLRNKFNLQGEFPHKSIGRNKRIKKTHFDDDTKELILDTYMDDFNEFGYNKDINTW